jgi:hypothetical protein
MRPKYPRLVADRRVDDLVDWRRRADRRRKRLFYRRLLRAQRRLAQAA